MVDREKVIKGFECCHVMVHDLGPDKTSCGICPYKDIQTEEQIDLGGIECIAVLHDDALALLKEKETVEPSVDVDTYVCPNCGHRLEHQGMLGDNVIFDERYNFCPACGKAVKWDAAD